MRGRLLKYLNVCRARTVIWATTNFQQLNSQISIMTCIIAVGEVNMSYNMLSQKMNKEQRLFTLLCGSCFVFPVIFFFSFNHFSFKCLKGKKLFNDIVWSIHKEDNLLWTNIYKVQTCFLEYKKIIKRIPKDNKLWNTC